MGWCCELYANSNSYRFWLKGSRISSNEETNDPTFVSGYWRESGVSGFRALAMSKDLFKKVVKAKIKLNHSDCTIDSAKEIIEIVLDKGFKIKDNLDMTVTFFLESYGLSDRELVKLMFPLSSGVKVDFSRVKMSIDKLVVFSETGDNNTDGLNLTQGFPSKLQPARQWHNWLFNKITLKINSVIDGLNDLVTNKVDSTDIVDNLESNDSDKPLSAKMGQKLNNDKLNKNDLATGDAPIFAARAWVNFNGSTGEIRKSGNITSVVRNGHGGYSVTFTKPMPHADYVIVTGVSNFGAGTNFGVISQTINGFTLQAVYGGDNTIGEFDPILAMVAIFVN